MRHYDVGRLVDSVSRLEIVISVVGPSEVTDSSFRKYKLSLFHEKSVRDQTCYCIFQAKRTVVRTHLKECLLILIAFYHMTKGLQIVYTPWRTHNELLLVRSWLYPQHTHSEPYDFAADNDAENGESDVRREHMRKACDQV